jgi:hypothetical protein
MPDSKITPYYPKRKTGLSARRPCRVISFAPSRLSRTSGLWLAYSIKPEEHRAKVCNLLAYQVKKREHVPQIADRRIINIHAYFNTNI